MHGAVSCPMSADYPPYRPTLEPVYFKIERAKKHLDEVNSIVESFIKAGPYAETRHDYPEQGVHVRRFELKRLTRNVPLLVGEVVYHLRSSLDHLAWQLALLST